MHFCTNFQHLVYASLHLYIPIHYLSDVLWRKKTKTRMWANAQRDGRPAEYRWRPLFNAPLWLTPTTTAPCSNAAKTRNPLQCAGMPQTRQQISAAVRRSSPYCEYIWARHCCLTFFSRNYGTCRQSTPRHITCVLVWSKSDQRRLRKTLHKQTNRQTDKQTDRQTLRK